MLRLYNSFQMLQPTVKTPHYLIHLEGVLQLSHFSQALQLCPNPGCEVII